MESQCEYFMYFPAAPLSTLSDPAHYRTLPRRKHVYLGETLHVLLVVRFRDTAVEEKKRAGSGCVQGHGGALSQWRELVGSLSALASVCEAESKPQRAGEQEEDIQSTCSEEDEEEEEEETGADGRGTPFRQCRPVLNQTWTSEGRQCGKEQPVKSPLVLDDQVIFCLTVPLDRLPVNTLKAKVVVTVWRQGDEKADVREHGYRTLLQFRSPTHIFRQDLSTFKAQVTTSLNVLPPPSVHCQQMTVSGKHLTVLKVLNCSSQEELCVRDMKILPNYNSSYLPMMPDGSVLIVDNVCHQPAEVSMASFCRIHSKSSCLPSMLSALEEQNFVFQLQLQHKEEEDSSEGLEVPLVAVLQWYTPSLPFTRYISSCYSLPSIRLDRPGLVMTASCPRAVRPLELFWVKYTLLNNLHDFLAVRLTWNTEAHAGGQHNPGLGAVVCQSSINHLGQCKKGSTLSFNVAFQILRSGLFELSQNMKLKLQFTRSGSNNLTETQSPLRNSSSSSSSSPAVKELLNRHSVGRSQSFSHQHPTRPHHARSGSVMDRGSAIGQPVYVGPEHGAPIPLDKIAKRECQVLVLEHVHKTHGRV